MKGEERAFMARKHRSSGTERLILLEPEVEGAVEGR